MSPSAQPSNEQSTEPKTEVTNDKQEDRSTTSELGPHGLWTDFFSFAQEIHQMKEEWSKLKDHHNFPIREWADVDGAPEGATMYDEIMTHMNDMDKWTSDIIKDLRKKIKPYQIIHVLDPYARLSDDKYYVEGLPESVERLYLEYMTVIAPQEFDWEASENGLFQLVPKPGSKQFERMIVHPSEKKLYLWKQVEHLMKEWKDEVARIDEEIAERDERQRVEKERIAEDARLGTVDGSGKSEQHQNEVQNADQDDDADEDEYGEQYSDEDEEMDMDDYNETPEGRRECAHSGFVGGVWELLDGRKEGAGEQFLGQLLGDYDEGGLEDEIFRYSPWGCCGGEMDRLLRKDRYRRWF